jgi:hypothetical protein
MVGKVRPLSRERRPRELDLVDFNLGQELDFFSSGFVEPQVAFCFPGMAPSLDERLCDVALSDGKDLDLFLIFGKDVVFFIFSCGGTGFEKDALI